MTRFERGHEDHHRCHTPGTLQAWVPKLPWYLDASGRMEGETFLAVHVASCPRCCERNMGEARARNPFPMRPPQLIMTTMLRRRCA